MHFYDAPSDARSAVPADAVVERNLVRDSPFMFLSFEHSRSSAYATYCTAISDTCWEQLEMLYDTGQNDLACIVCAKAFVI
jgi:hypothetical protein